MILKFTIFKIILANNYEVNQCILTILLLKIKQALINLP